MFATDFTLIDDTSFLIASVYASGLAEYRAEVVVGSGLRDTGSYFGVATAAGPVACR